MTDPVGKLAGIFTDSDLAKLFENRHDDAIDRPVSEVMTRDPVTVIVGTRVGAALDIMCMQRLASCRWSTAGSPRGLDITDLIGLPARADALSLPQAIRRRRIRMTPAIAARLQAIDWLILDVDGVLTDGTILYSDAGQELQGFHVRDGSGLALWRRAGKCAAAITGRGSKCLNGGPRNCISTRS